MSTHPAWKTTTWMVLIFSIIAPAGCVTSSPNPILQDPLANASTEGTAVASNLIGWLAEADMVPARELITPDIPNEKLLALSATLAAMGEFKNLALTNSTRDISSPNSNSWVLTTTATFSNARKTITFKVVLDPTGVYKVMDIAIAE